MSTIRSHLTVLEESARQYASLPAFKLPVIDSATKAILQWRSITYRQFLDDVERVARYWLRRLTEGGITHRSVVGLWLGGMAYTDVVHVYAVARAGYIPQLFSLRLPNPDVIYELMVKADAKALIFDTSSVCSFDGAPVPTYPAIPSDVIRSDSEAALPSIVENLTGTDTFCIFHTSGSTSGIPKVIRCSYSWLDNIITKADFLCKRRNPARQDVTTWVGSMSHIAQTFMLIGALNNGACVVQPSQIPFPASELIDMVERCSLNCLRLFGTFLSIHLRNARSNPALLSALKSLDEAFYCGIGIAPEDEAYAFEQGIRLRNVFGSTEVGAMLYTPDGERFMRQLPGTQYAFQPIDGEKPASKAGAGPRNANNTALLELIILRESADCPDPSLCHADGNYHTGDLFQEVMPGSFVFRGRNDDWIKSENSLRCDTKSIEDNVRAMCGDLIEDCIVVGSGRASPALFIEPSVTWDEHKLRKEIVRRIKHFHSRRYMHERIVHPDFVVVVPSRTLPRTSTKGNIRRRAVEDTFKATLDTIYCVKA